MIETEHLSYEVIGTTAVVTMNRPEAKNSLSGPMLVGMVDAWTEIDANDDIRCAILTGAGGTFCSGHGPEVDVRARATRRCRPGWPPTPTCTGRRCSATTSCASR